MPEDLNTTEDAVKALYRSDPTREWERSQRHRTEFAVTQRALAEHLPPPPARILDCGGGPGFYAIALSRQGYQVTLFDLSPDLLALAREKATAQGTQLDDYVEGTATDLSRYADNVFDAVLLMGPMYHLLDADARLQALREAYRVTKPGKPVFIAFISRYAGHRNAAKHFPEHAYTHPELYATMSKTGQLPPREDGEVGFVGYFTHPDEIQPLCRQVGFEVTTLLGLEGAASLHEEKINALDGKVWAYWVDINYAIAHDPAILGGVEHILAVCTKPRWRGVLRELALTLAQKHIAYKVVGGTALALRGIEVPVNDLDLEMTVNDAYRFEAIYKDHTKHPVQLREKDGWRSHIGQFEVDGVNIEVMGGLSSLVRDTWAPSFLSTTTTVKLDDLLIPVLELEEEVLAYLRRGRLDRAALALPYCRAERLAELFRDAVQKGML